MNNKLGNDINNLARLIAILDNYKRYWRVEQNPHRVLRNIYNLFNSDKQIEQIVINKVEIKMYRQAIVIYSPMDKLDEIYYCCLETLNKFLKYKYFVELRRFSKCAICDGNENIGEGFHYYLPRAHTIYNEETLYVDIIEYINSYPYVRNGKSFNPYDMLNELYCKVFWTAGDKLFTFGIGEKPVKEDLSTNRRGYLVDRDYDTVIIHDIMWEDEQTLLELVNNISESIMRLDL